MIGLGEDWLPERNPCRNNRSLPPEIQSSMRHLVTGLAKLNIAENGPQPE